MLSNLYVIDGLREMIRQTTDDSVFSDEFLFFNLNNARIMVMRQYINDGKPISPWLYQRFCIKLCPSTFIECNCKPFKFGCTVWRSEKPLPKPLTTNTGYIAEFSELFGEQLYPLTENESRYVQFRRWTNKQYYMIGDVGGEKHLFVMSEKQPAKYIKINAVLEDPTEAQYASCTEEECPDPTGNGFPIESHLLVGIYKITLEFMGMTMSMTEDRSNNAEGDTKGFKGPRNNEEQG